LLFEKTGTSGKKEILTAGEIVPDREIVKFKKIVRAEYKETKSAWEKAKKEAKKTKQKFDRPKPPEPKFKVFKKNLTLEEAQNEVDKLKGIAAIANKTVLDNWRDAYKEETEARESEKVRKPEKPKGKHFTVMTYNLNYGSSKPVDSVKVILESKADIVFLQETNKEWEKLLRRVLKKEYPHCLFRQPGEKYKGEGQAVFSKRKVSELKWIESGLGWFPGWLVQADTPIGELQVLALHLKPVSYKKARKDAQEIKDTMETHVKEIEAFYKNVKKNTPLLVLGDLNESDSGPAMKWLKEKGFIDALPEFDRKTPTWRAKLEGMTIEERPDHILYSKHLHCYEAKVIKKGNSDHYPVLAGFEKKSESKKEK
jgi:endonuclease/exonuclease/phosphatase family metal-dependent hydrolase